MREKEAKQAKKRGFQRKESIANKPKKRISQTKFHYGRIYYGKELLE